MKLPLLQHRRRSSADEDQRPSLHPAGLDAVEVNSRWVRAGDDYSTTLAVVGYPAEVSAGWLEPLLAYPGKLDVSLHIEPVPPQVAADRLRRQRGRLESARRHDADKGRLDDPRLDAAAHDAAALAGQLARGEGKLFRLGVYLTVHGTSPEELSDTVADVRSVCASMLLDAVPATWRQLQGWTTTLPLGVDSLRMTRTFDTAALAAGFPFTSPDLPLEDTGRQVLYGPNLSSAGIVMWDRWNEDNYNSVILARSGAGKSYLAKLDLLRNLYLGVEAFVLDPEDEYIALAEAVGGVVIRPGTPGVKLNPLELDLADPDALTNRVSFMHTVIQVLLAGDHATGDETVLPADQAAALDKAVAAAYRTKGITADARTWRRRAPLLSDVATALEDSGPAGVTLAGRLSPYTTGSRSKLFDGPTTTGPGGHLTVFATRDLPDELAPAATLLILDAVWKQITTTARERGARRHRLVVVDEAWMTLRTGLGARWLERLAKSARKYGVGLVTVTQDAADVLDSKIGKAVVSNAATQILMRQAPQAIDAITTSFGLTDGERTFLLSAGRGDALLVAGGRRVAFRALASAAEHELVLNSPFGDDGTTT